ncbi:hypothetical protein RHSIM_Rhsim07G0120400 [Rhododendron simsii]|uniref:FLZ-type domain-containing protein n=1 Tax=Rhododendron simsii TaxID=118357 RepID=A0A834GQQ1_RHOSS|nr:hypothetical protein RHSIM_Rhsim07G0120400 [Rhododendron simsii]
MDSKPTIRRPCFADNDDDGLASIAGTAEPGFSGHHHHPFLSTRPVYHTSIALQRRGSLRNLSSISSAGPSNSPRSGYYSYEVNRFDQEMNQPHFLDACFLCKKPLRDNDIFMYRGDTPFCSEECRREQIEKDEAKENKWNHSVSMKALRKDQKLNSNPTTNSPNKPQKNYPFPTSTVAAA